MLVVVDVVAERIDMFAVRFEVTSSTWVDRSSREFRKLSRKRGF